MGATQKQPASEAMEKFFPPRYMDGSDGSDYDQSVLESYLIEKWASLRSKSVHDCVRIYLNCTRKWQFFGAQLFSVQVSTTTTAILLSYCKTSTGCPIDMLTTSDPILQFLKPHISKSKTCFEKFVKKAFR